MPQDRNETIATLTAERDREIGVRDLLTKQVATLTAERDQLKWELDASQSALADTLARVKELEGLLLHVLCQDNGKSTINIEAISAALKPSGEEE